MKGFKQIIGVDISKDHFDAVGEILPHGQFQNNTIGFRAFKKVVGKNTLVVMEATGYYHYCLSQFLFQKGIKVAVVNPLSVKRFIQMKLAKIKTDKSDAKAICEYAMNNELRLYQGQSAPQREAMQLIQLQNHYLKKLTATKNKVRGEKILGLPSNYVYRSLKRDLKHVEHEIRAIDGKIFGLLSDEKKQQLTLLTSIPGIGMKTAVLLVVVTDGFTKFDSAAKLRSYAGITPNIRVSGSSVRGRSRISKLGNKKLRNLLFICSFSAVKHNEACINLYERLVGKGKSKKLALIAVANKLLVQAFAIVKNGKPYEKNYGTHLSGNGTLT